MSSFKGFHFLCYWNYAFGISWFRFRCTIELTFSVFRFFFGLWHFVTVTWKMAYTFRLITSTFLTNSYHYYVAVTSILPTTLVQDLTQSLSCEEMPERSVYGWTRTSINRTWPAVFRVAPKTHMKLSTSSWDANPRRIISRFGLHAEAQRSALSIHCICVLYLQTLSSGPTNTIPEWCIAHIILSWVL